MQNCQVPAPARSHAVVMVPVDACRVEGASRVPPPLARIYMRDHSACDHGEPAVFDGATSPQPRGRLSCRVLTWLPGHCPGAY